MSSPDPEPRADAPGDPATPPLPAAAAPKLVAVLDMGASAIRLAVAELTPSGPPRIIEEASKGVLLGRDTFSFRAIRSQTIDAAITALSGFARIMKDYGVDQVQAVATSAVREARNGDMFLDRIQSRTGIAFDIINEAEESRLVFLAVRGSLKRHAAFKGARTLLAEVGGGSTSLTLLRRGQPSRSGVYALGSVRLRQQLDLRRHSQDVQMALLRRYVANVIDEIRIEIPLSRITQFIAIGGDVRFAASQIGDEDLTDPDREIPRERFLAFCDEVSQLDEDRMVERFRLPAVEAETLAPALAIYRALLAETGARNVVVSSASLRAGLLLEMTEPTGRLSVEDFEQQVLESADTLGQRYRVDREHGQQVATLAARLFDELREEHGLGDRERLLLKVAGLLHDIGIYVSLRGHHKHSQYILAESQIFGLSAEETAIVSNLARYHRRGTPQRTHVPYVALDRRDRLVVNKLAAILRIANALDAEHVQKVRAIHVTRRGSTWVLQLEGTGDLTMERLAATARADMFVETFGRQVIVQPPGAA
ncbi:MAG TPA: Ppx/GppA phosphatase family protein [Vicinamibacterales bacterium]|nr:Ppx/GppA phosphatase family protein [Vicinamibacterales bacterium]